jgi:glycosyltransferase involved in cell wall biosynthesis
MSDYQILMLMDLPARPVTGGEIYNYKIYEYLKAGSSKVEKVPTPIRPHRSKLEFFLNSIRQNLSMLGVLREINGKTIIFEDISSSSDLFIFNLIVRHSRGLLGKKIRIVPIVHQVYAPLAEKGIKRSIKSLEESIFLNSSDRIIVNSEFTKRSVQSLLRGEKDMVIAYPGLNVFSDDKDSKDSKDGKGRQTSKDTSKDPENLRLLFVGYITPRKGVDTLVESFKILVKDYGIDNLVLDVVGDASRSPDLLAGMERYCQDAGIQDKVKFHGRVSEERLEELYSLADIFVFPSIWEGFGMVLIEAMHNRLPIVTTNAGAIPFLVKDGVNGFLVPVKDAEKLAHATRKLIESPQLRREIGETNYKVADQFRWVESLSKIKKFLDEAFDDKN